MQSHLPDKETLHTFLELECFQNIFSVNSILYHILSYSINPILSYIFRARNFIF